MVHIFVCVSQSSRRSRFEVLGDKMVCHAIDQIMHGKDSFHLRAWVRHINPGLGVAQIEAVCSDQDRRPTAIDKSDMEEEKIRIRDICQNEKDNVGIPFLCS
jgi:hypothetical protein